MNKEIIRVGIVGFGLAGSVFHAPLIRSCSRMKITGVLTSRGIPERVSSLEELISGCDLVVVASPNTTHFQIARQALEAGRHVVVDKPFTVTLDEADELIALAEQSNQKLSVFHNRRWDSDFLTVREVIAQLGDVMLFEANWDRFRPAIKQGWREVAEAGSGVLSDLGPHLFDQALQLFGMPDALEADIAAQREGAAVDDFFDVTLHYGRARVALRSSTLVAAPRPRFAVHGTRGSWVKPGLDPQEAQLKAGLDPTDAEFGVDRTQATLTSPDGSVERVAPRRGNYRAFYEAMADAILGGSPVPVAPADARDCLALIDLARRASVPSLRVAVSESSPKAE
jgi:scyllo-inositol 2-dehydrogenase (NADP+)